MIYDAAIIGGGAAGMCAAVRLKQNRPNSKIIIIEQLSRVGKKLIVTGNGRCNITNSHITPEHFHGAHREFSVPALKKYSGKPTADFFRSIGVEIVFDNTGRGYPYSMQASSVVDALRFAASENGIDILCDCRVTDFIKTRNGYNIITASGEIQSDYIIVAAGMCSGGEKLGSNGSIYKLLKEKGYPHISPAPAIVQLKTEPSAVRPLKGIKINAEAQLIKNKKIIRREYGEVLFCDYGLSGPPILQLSGPAGRNEKGLEISLKLMPEYDQKQLNQLLLSRLNALRNRPTEEFFTGLLNKRIGQQLLKQCGISEKITQEDIPRISRLINNWKFKINGTTGFINSQVTSGGLDTIAFIPETMESKIDRKLFAIGEILDIDGDCGGFNLQWAWSSAFSAADEITRQIGGIK